MTPERQLKITIDADRCNHDGLCARVCPSRIFRWDKGELPTVQGTEHCVLCGQCLAICPSDAIAQGELPVDQQRRIERAGRADPEQLLGFLRQRRSVRSYKDKPVPRELLQRVAEMAGYAPTGAFGGDGWVRRVTVVSDPAVMDEVREHTVVYLRKLHKLLSGLMIQAVARFNEEARGGLITVPDLAMRLAEWDAGRDAVTYDAPAAVFVSAARSQATPHEDTDAALMNMMLAADALGLGTCWNGWLGHAAGGDHVGGFDALHRRLGLPEHHKVVQAFTVGWPALRLHSEPERRTEVSWVE